MLIVDAAMIWRIYDESDDEDRDDFVVKEIRCCNCFFDKVIAIINGKSEITFELLRRITTTLRRCLEGHTYLFFSEISIFCCDKSKVIFESACEIDKGKMDENCVAPSIDYCCLYFLSRETYIYSICDGCKRTILRLISKRLIKIKFKK